MGFAIVIGMLVLLNIAVAKWGADSREPGDWTIPGSANSSPRVDEHLDVGRTSGG